MSKEKSFNKAMLTWGRKKLEKRYPDEAFSTVAVYPNFSPGYDSGCNTCGSWGPEASLRIEGWTSDHELLTLYYDLTSLTDDYPGGELTLLAELLDWEEDE